MERMSKAGAGKRSATALVCVLASLTAWGYQQQPAKESVEKLAPAPSRVHLGFDRNDYPGDAAMVALRNNFAFTGYWLTPPPSETANTWLGKRALLAQQGWGFLVLANGKLDKEILKAQRAGTTPAQLGKQDAQAATALAKSEGFPAHTVLFLDQEEGGVLLPEQSAYLLGWTEEVAASEYRAGVYASGQPVRMGDGKTMNTIEHIRTLVREQHLHNVAFFGYQDACPPAPGCTLTPKPVAESGDPGLLVWQYAQSPRRGNITKACAKTYAADNNCYAPNAPGIFLDLDAATIADPSHGR